MRVFHCGGRSGVWGGGGRLLCDRQHSGQGRALHWPAGGGKTGPLLVTAQVWGSQYDADPALLCHKNGFMHRKNALIETFRPKAPRKGLWVHWAVSLWHKRAGIATHCDPLASSWAWTGPVWCRVSTWPLVAVALLPRAAMRLGTLWPAWLWLGTGCQILIGNSSERSSSESWLGGGGWWQ